MCIFPSDASDSEAGDDDVETDEVVTFRRISCLDLTSKFHWRRRLLQGCANSVPTRDLYP